MLGWVVEVINSLCVKHKFVNRGFLIGPYCPIYGIGCVSMIVLLQRYFNDPLILFVMSMVIFSILEYFTSWAMEKIFNARWWDYSNKKYNLNGRICLETMIPFGLGGLLIVYIINPILMHLILMIPIFWRQIITAIIAVIFFTDVIISYNIIAKFKHKALAIAQDSTEEITQHVRDWLEKRSYLTKRLSEAFPELEIHLKQARKKITKEIRDFKKELGKK